MCGSFAREDLNYSHVLLWLCSRRKEVCIIFKYFSKGKTSGMFTSRLLGRKKRKKKKGEKNVNKCKILLVFVVLQITVAIFEAG